MAMIGARRPQMPVPPLGGVPLTLAAAAAPSLAYTPPPAPTSQQQVPSWAPDLPIAPPKPKVNWAGIIADALAGAMGQPGMYAQRMNHQQDEQTAFERGEEQWKRHHDIDFHDQLSLLDYKRAHPDDELTQYMQNAGIDPSSDAGKSVYRSKVQAMTAPPMMSAQGVDEQGNPVMRFFPRAPAVSQDVGAPSIGTVRNGYRFKGGDPADPVAWEKLGGPTQPASGGFR